MEFITVEQFQEQPVEVQKVFLDWWNPSDGDIYLDIYKNNNVIECCHYIKFMNNEDVNNMKEDGDAIPLFTEGQLRKFIEDKTECKNIELKGNIESNQYDLLCFKEIWSCCGEREYNKLGTNVLQAYWKVACMIAKEEPNG